MIVNLAPRRGDRRYTASVDGDVLTVDGTAYDFSPLPEGGELPRAAVDCPWLAGDVRREAGQIVLTLILPHGPLAPQGTRFPAPIRQDAGVLNLPDWGAEERT